MKRSQYEMKIEFDGAIFHCEIEAISYVQNYVWTNGPLCPRCGPGTSVGLLGGGSTRRNTYKCYTCRGPFTVRIGTLFHGSKIATINWLRALAISQVAPVEAWPRWFYKNITVSRRSAQYMATRICLFMGDSCQSRNIPKVSRSGEYLNSQILQSPMKYVKAKYQDWLEPQDQEYLL